MRTEINDIVTKTKRRTINLKVCCLKILIGINYERYFYKIAIILERLIKKEDKVHK